MTTKKEHSEEYMKGYHCGYVNGINSVRRPRKSVSRPREKDCGLIDISLIPKQGKWRHIEGDDNTFVCPFCETHTYTEENSDYIPKFCMECGSKLEVVR